MNPALILQADGDRVVEIHRADGGLLLRYVYRPETAPDEAPRPYAHPVNTLAGALLTNFRPNDHRWHHGLNFTINCLSGHNFWGGGTYRPADGYQMRGDHGSQLHTGWIEQRAARLAHTLDWRVNATGELLLQEERALAFAVVSPQVWTLRWTARLRNVADRTLGLGQYFRTRGSPARTTPGCSSVERATCSTIISMTPSASSPRAASVAKKPSTAPPPAGWNGADRRTRRCAAWPSASTIIPVRFTGSCGATTRSRPCRSNTSRISRLPPGRHLRSTTPLSSRTHEC